MRHLFIDFETRSNVDLKDSGAAVYAAAPKTEIICASYAFDDEEVQIWRPGEPHQFGDLTDTRVVVHNCFFDLQIWTHKAIAFGFAPIGIEQIEDTMAMALRQGLPASLEHAALAAGIEHKKDTVGARAMMQLAKPKGVSTNGELIWLQDGDKMKELEEYAKQDTRTHRCLFKALTPLDEYERRIFELDYQINTRGVYVDVKLAAICEKEAEKGKEAADKHMATITDGLATSCTSLANIKNFLSTKGVTVESLDKPTVMALLESGELSEEARNCLLLRQDASRSSLAKFTKISKCVTPDNRLKGMHQYYGAGTGRWAGRLVQLQNLPRQTVDNDEIMRTIRILSSGDTLSAHYSSPLSVLPNLIRPMLTAEKGRSLMAGDFSNIEGRVLSWLAGENWKIKAFRDYDKGVGEDLYIVTAAKMFSLTLSEAANKRQEGKCAELALGYEGGVGAFQRMAKAYKFEVSDEKAEEIKKAWRSANPKIVALWRIYDNAAKEAIRCPGAIIKADKIQFLKKSAFLLVKLPSGRKMFFPYPELRPYTNIFGKPSEEVVYKTKNQTTGKWGFDNMYGGKWAENITQAVARDILCEAMLRLSKTPPYDEIVMHVHDEIVVETSSAAGATEDEFNKLMAENPPWAEGLPISVSGWFAPRYRK